MTVPREHAQHFGNGDWDQAYLQAGVGAAVQGDGDGQVHAGEQAQRAPAVPGPPADDLAGVQAGDLLGELVIFLDPPPGLRDGDQPGQRHRPGCPAPVERAGAGIPVAADQQCAVPGIAAVAGGVVTGHLQHRPVVMAAALGAVPGAHPLPGAAGDQPDGPGRGQDPA